MPGWSSTAFWQYTSLGSAPGITGNVDLDYLGPILQVSATGTAITPVQLQTLSSLNGQPVTYSPVSLPPGLSVGSSGQITGTPTSIGASQASITASAGPPTTISFTWDVYGTLSLAPATVTTTAGVPVLLQVRATDADAGATGYTPPVFTASGLPAGMAISSSGLITGWPATPGTYKITVSATDGLGATGTTSIAWTVKAAADVGVTGAIRQNGGSGKCLDDPSSRTANGTAIDLATCTGKPNQSWTAVQDGSIRVLGLCLTASGARVLLYGCNSTVGEEWRAGTDGALVSVRYGTCLTGPTAAVANGVLATLAACTNSATSTAQHWSRPVTPIVSGTTGRCLNVSGSSVTMFTCGNLTSEHWTIAASGEIGVQSTGTCLTESGTAAGAAITSVTCFNAASQHWTLVGAGTIPEEIKNAASGLCVTVPSGATANNTPMVLGTCSTAPNSTWRVG
jgi:beta-glucosidase